MEVLGAGEHTALGDCKPSTEHQPQVVERPQQLACRKPVDQDGLVVEAAQGSRVRPFAFGQGRLGEPPELRRRFGIVEHGVRQQSRAHRVLRGLRGVLHGRRQRLERIVRERLGRAKHLVEVVEVETKHPRHIDQVDVYAFADRREACHRSCCNVAQRP